MNKRFKSLYFFVVKDDGGIISIIRLFESQKNGGYSYTIVEGGVGFNYVILKVQAMFVDGRNKIDIFLS